jgi:hypothetical protein
MATIGLPHPRDQRFGTFLSHGKGPRNGHFAASGSCFDLGPLSGAPNESGCFQLSDDR